MAEHTASDSYNLTPEARCARQSEAVVTIEVIVENR